MCIVLFFVVGSWFFPLNYERRTTNSCTFAAPMPSHAVTLYTRAGCHLCDDAQALLVRHGLRPELVDIDSDQNLLRTV